MNNEELTTDFSVIKQKLNNLDNLHPFVLLFYGSRERGDHNNYSDYNFYLIASPQDQIRSSFIHAINSILEDTFYDQSISLIASDKESLLYRMEILEPTITHVMEMGKVIYGDKEFILLKEKWAKCKSGEFIPKPLLNYLETRTKFYKSLKSKNTKDDVSRIEKIIALTIQTWVICAIDDLTITEIAYLDIPSRLTKLVKIMYDKKMPKDIQLLTSIYEEVHELKRSMNMMLTGTNGYIDKLKGSISQLQGLSREIEKIV